MQTLRRPRTPGAVRRPLLSALLCTALAACSSDDDSGGGAVVPPDDGGSSNDSTVALFTRVSNPGSRNFYLHLLEEMPSGGVLDYSRAFEFGEAFMSVDSGFVYISDREAMSITKYAVTDERGIEELGTVSLQGLGVQFIGVYWAAPGQPYVVDTFSGQVVRWDPETMEIIDSTPVPPEFLFRENLPAFPWSWDAVTADGRAYFNWAWSDFEAQEAVMEGAIASFPLDDAPVFSNFVFDEDYRLDLLETLDARDSVLFRVNLDGSVTEVVGAGPNGDFQSMARVR